MPDKRHIVPATVFAVLLAIAATTEWLTGVKDDAMRQLVFWSGVGLLVFAFGGTTVRAIVFSLFFSLVTYVCIFTVVIASMQLLDSDNNTIEVDGQIHRVMDMSWIWGVVFGIVLTVAGVWQYHKRVERNYWLETGFCTGCFVIFLFRYLNP